jgi:hypothetical protein
MHEYSVLYKYLALNSKDYKLGLTAISLPFGTGLNTEVERYQIDFEALALHQQ